MGDLNSFAKTLTWEIKCCRSSMMRNKTWHRQSSKSSRRCLVAQMPWTYPQGNMPSNMGVWQNSADFTRKSNKVYELCWEPSYIPTPLLKLTPVTMRFLYLYEEHPSHRAKVCFRYQAGWRGLRFHSQRSELANSISPITQTSSPSLEKTVQTRQSLPSSALAVTVPAALLHTGCGILWSSSGRCGLCRGCVGCCCEMLQKAFSCDSDGSCTSRRLS